MLSPSKSFSNNQIGNVQPAGWKDRVAMNLHLNPNAMVFQPQPARVLLSAEAMVFQPRSAMVTFNPEASTFNPRSTKVCLNPTASLFIPRCSISPCLNPLASDFKPRSKLNGAAMAFVPPSRTNQTSSNDFHPEGLLNFVEKNFKKSKFGPFEIVPISDLSGLPGITEEFCEQRWYQMAREQKEEIRKEQEEAQAKKEAARAKEDKQPVVHHLNFLGAPVYTKSNTPPATSLAIIMGTSRIQPQQYLPGANNLRVACVTHNASTYLDPVCLRGDPSILLESQGSKLEDQATGRTTKAYLEYGSWTKDTYTLDEDVPEVDPLDAEVYTANELYFNGLISNSICPSRDEVYQDAIYNESHKQDVCQRNIQQRRELGVGKSRLSIVSTLDDCVEGESGSKKQVEAPIPTCSQEHHGTPSPQVNQFQRRPVATRSASSSTTSTRTLEETIEAIRSLESISGNWADELDEDEPPSFSEESTLVASPPHSPSSAEIESESISDSESTSSSSISEEDDERASRSLKRFPSLVRSPGFWNLRELDTVEEDEVPEQVSEEMSEEVRQASQATAVVTRSRKVVTFYPHRLSTIDEEPEITEVTSSTLEDAPEHVVDDTPEHVVEDTPEHVVEDTPEVAPEAVPGVVLEASPEIALEAGPEVAVEVAPEDAPNSRTRPWSNAVSRVSSIQIGLGLAGQFVALPDPLRALTTTQVEACHASAEPIQFQRAEVQAEKISWTYRAWSKCKQVLKLKNKQGMKVRAAWGKLKAN